jgi:hypothetical protein
MNRRVFLLAIASAAILIGTCRENKQMPRGSSAQPAKSAEITPFDPIADSLRMDSLFDALLELEQAVAATPDDRRAVKNLCAKSLDSLAGCFYLVGTGVKNPSLPEDAQPAARKTAAKFSAEKWALYLKALHCGEKITYGETVKGRVLYTKELRTRITEDSLYMLVMVPVGSVVAMGR